MNRPRVIRLSKLWSPGKVIWHSFLAGLLVYLGVLLAMMTLILTPSLSFILNSKPASFVNPLLFCVFLPVFLAAPGVLLWRYQHMIQTGRRAILSGVGCGLGAVFPLVVFSLGNSDTKHWRGVLIAVLVSCAVYGIMNLLMMLVFRKVRGPLVIQDGFRCPNCAYCLIGCPAMVCPECGQTFTHGQLGISKEEFERGPVV